MANASVSSSAASNVAMVEGWIVRPGPRLRPRSRLLCIPFAGGNSSVFREWPPHLPATIDVCAIELPGRQRRMAEAPVRDLAALLSAVMAAVAPLLDRPIAVFGNCTGSLIAFELARALEEAGAPVAGLFVSCCRAPQLPDPDPPIHQLSDREIVGELERLGGTPQELIDHPELFTLLLPTLRADFELAERYVYTPGPPLTAPISAFGGLDDGIVSLDSIDPWREQTRGAFSKRMIPGGHYLLETSRAHLTAAIAADLEPWA